MYGKSPMEIAAKELEELIGAAKSPMSAIDALKAETTQNRLTRTMYKMFNGDPVTIVCFGDSVTRGNKPVGSGVAEHPYPSVLQERLRTVYENENITVINSGNSAWQTDEALADIQVQVLDHEPDLTIVMFGINDCRGGSLGEPKDEEEYRSNLKEITSILMKNDIETILLSPTPIRDTRSKWEKKLRVFAKVVKEVASVFNVGFVDMQDEINRFLFAGEVAPLDFLPDKIHIADDWQGIIADILLARVLQHNEPGGVLYVDSRNEFSVPIVQSAFVQTNMSFIYSNEVQKMKESYRATLNDTGFYLKFNFFVSVPKMSLMLRSPKNPSGGEIDVYDGDAKVTTIDFFGSEYNELDAETTIIENLSMGWHSIVFDQINARKGQSTGAGDFFFSDFIFMPNELKDDTLFLNAGTGTLPVMEKFKRVLDGTLRLTNSVAGEYKGVVLFGSEQAELKAEKTLVIEAEIKTYSTGGFTWFGNRANNSSSTHPPKVNSGYMLYMGGAGSSAVARLYKYGASNALDQLVQESITIDYSQHQKVRIEHKYSGNIKVYINGTLVIDHIDTTNKEGYFGLWEYGAGTIEITRLEFCYI